MSITLTFMPVSSTMSCRIIYSQFQISLPVNFLSLALSICEELENVDGLHFIFKIVRGISEYFTSPFTFQYINIIILILNLIKGFNLLKYVIGLD